MFNITLKTDWNHQSGKGVSLLPEVGPVSVDIPISYDSACRFDYARAIEDAEAQLYQAWRFRLDLRSATTTEGGFEGSLKQMLVESLIRQEPDVLGDFTLDSSGLGGEGERLSLPLVMGGSNYAFSVDCTPGPEGKPDGGAIVEALAQAYCEVFQLPGSEMVFSAGQQAELEQKAANWAQGLMAEAGLALPKVEVNLETHAWVGNSLRLCVDVYNDAKVQYELLMPVSNKGELDYSGIEQVAAQIAQEMIGRLGPGSPEWLAKHIAQQIEPDAKEYAAWIIEVENNIRAEFWEAMNREMAGHLKKAEDLHAKAKKWRQDYDKWLKDGANVKVEVKQEEPEPVTKFSYSLSELPGQLLSDFVKIWDGLCELPGAVKKGLDENLDEMVEGTIQGFRMAKVVVGESWIMLLQKMGLTSLVEYAEYLFGEFLKKRWEKKVGVRRAQFRMYGYAFVTFAVGRFLVYKEVQQLQREFPDMAMRANRKILEVIEEVNVKKVGAER